MFTTIVWATDGSGGAELARVEAARLCAQTGARLVAVHCDERFSGRAAGWPVHADEDDRLTRIREDAAAMRRVGLHVELVTRLSAHEVADVVAGVASELGAELVVCGTRGYGALHGAFV